MKAVLHLPQRATYVDYLAVEQASDRRHEYFDGVIVAMAGGSPEHNALTARFVQLLGANLPRGCRAFTPDRRYWIAATRRGRYSDASVICGRVEHPMHDDQPAENPRIVIEVLSPTTAGDDEGEKRRDFQTLASLEAYVLAAQDSQRPRWAREQHHSCARPNGRADGPAGSPSPTGRGRTGKTQRPMKDMLHARIPRAAATMPGPLRRGLGRPTL